MALLPDQESQFIESKQAPAFLEEQTGLKIAGPTLATRRCRGGGPLYSKFGKHVYYPKGELIAWALEKLGRPAATFSEHKAREVAGRLAEQATRRVKRKALEAATHDKCGKPIRREPFRGVRPHEMHAGPTRQEPGGNEGSRWADRSRADQSSPQRSREEANWKD
jgi:hypothetical protein